MYNWKKIVLVDFISYLKEENDYAKVIFTKDETVKELIDKFMEEYESNNQLDYINSIVKTKTDYESIKKFLYLTYLDKYTNCLDFNNTNKDELWNL